MRLWAKILAGFLAIVIAAIVAIPFFIDAKTFRPTLEARLSAGLGRPVKLGSLRLSLFTGSLVAEDLSIADDPAFSATPLLSAREVRIGVDMESLILHRQLHVRSLEIEAPQIHLVEGPNGQWNFSILSRNAASLTSTLQSKALVRSVVGSIKIREGRAVVETLPANGPPLVFDHVRLTVQYFALRQPFPFELGATLPGDGAVAVKGNVGPMDAQNAARTPADVDVSIQHLDPVVTGFLDPNAGVSVLANITAHAISDGSVVHSRGKFYMQGLQLRKTGVPSQQPLELTYDITHRMSDDTGTIQRASIGLGTGTIQLTGRYRGAGNDPWVDLKVAAAAVPIDELQSLMTAAGVKLPNGSELRGGTLGLALGFTGAANDLVVTGPVDLENARLVGYNLGSKIAGIASLGGIKTGSTTTIQTMKFTLQASNAGIQVKNIDSTIAGMGRSTGSGKVSSAGALSFRLVAHVTDAHGAGKIGVGLLTRLNQFGKPASDTEASRGVPMLVTGTANDPVITADVRGLMHRDASTAVDKLKHLFSKKNTSSADPR